MALPPPFARRSTTVAAVLLAAASIPGLAAAHTSHHPAAVSPSAAASAGMFVVADPARPRIARGPSGALWASSAPRAAGLTAMGQTFAERYLAEQRAITAQGVVARRSALTTKQATKKLTKKCQRLVTAKQPSKLSPASKKARTKCLKQRRKLIADSKKQPESKPGAPTSPAPATSPAPSSPTTPVAPTTPAPTTPAPTTPAPPAACTTPGAGDTLAITAFNEGAKFELSSCGLKAGKITFAFDNTDGSEDHNLVVADGYQEVTDEGQTSSTPVGMRAAVGSLHPGKSATTSATLPAGEYWLICTVPGHVAMAIRFKVFPA